MGRALIFALALLVSGEASAAARRILYVTATAGFRHEGAIRASVAVMQDLAAQSGNLEITHTEDLSFFAADRLRDFDAVYFFTSGELPLSNSQKTALLDFVRQGKGFGGSHSATDTLYTWPEYGELIGGVFDGHPWAQEATFDVEDAASPIVAHMAPAFRATEEIYQFRSFSRDRVRVLLSLDTRSVDLSAAGVNRTDGDFPMVWIRRYGSGRVFYSAFGHFEESFQLPVFRTMLLQALRWLAGEIEADASPRTAAPAITVAADTFAPGSLLAITGQALTTGRSHDASALPLPTILAGTQVQVNGRAAPMFFAKPDAILVQLPYSLTPGQPATVTVSNAGRVSNAVALQIRPAAPATVAESTVGGVRVIWAIGLGATQPAVPEGVAPPVSPLARTVLQPMVRIGGQLAAVDFSGLVPGFAGLYQVNVVIPSGATGPAEIAFQ